MNWNDVFKEVALSTGLPQKTVERIYKSYWWFIREHISSLPLNDISTEDEFNKLRTNFTLPALGKLCCTYDRFTRVRKNYNYLNELHDRKIRHD